MTVSSEATYSEGSMSDKRKNFLTEWIVQFLKLTEKVSDSFEWNELYWRKERVNLRKEVECVRENEIVTC